MQKCPLRFFRVFSDFSFQFCSGLWTENHPQAVQRYILRPCSITGTPVLAQFSALSLWSTAKEKQSQFLFSDHFQNSCKCASLLNTQKQSSLSMCEYQLHEWCVMNNYQCGMILHGDALCCARLSGVHSSMWSNTALYPTRGGDDPHSQWGLSFVYVCLALPQQHKACSSIGPALPSLSTVVHSGGQVAAGGVNRLPEVWLSRHMCAWSICGNIKAWQ